MVFCPSDCLINSFNNVEYSLGITFEELNHVCDELINTCLVQRDHCFIRPCGLNGEKMETVVFVDVDHAWDSFEAGY